MKFPKDWLRSKNAELRRALATWRLEAKLEKIFRVSNAHQLRQVKAGSTEYVSLWRAADAAVSKFCDEHGANRQELENQIPSLLNLQQLANPEPGMTPLAKAAMGTALTAVAALAIGIMAGLASLGFHVIVHWIH